MNKNIIDLIRASQEASQKEDFADGEVAGRRWAADRAEQVELERLAEAIYYDYAELGSIHENGPLAAVSYNLIQPDSTYAEAREFWETYGPENHPPSCAFIHGFIKGAVDLWYEVADKI